MASDCTPYLLQLGLTKSHTSLVWIAGPLSGLIMQPIVGVLADRSTSKWGRRRPFMVGGAIIVGLCLLVLGWTTEIVGTFVKEQQMVSDVRYRVKRPSLNRSQKRSCTVTLAVLSIYAVDFAINAGKQRFPKPVMMHIVDFVLVQASCRSLVVDTLPISKQQIGSAWGKCFPLRQYVRGH